MVPNKDETVSVLKLLSEMGPATHVLVSEVYPIGIQHAIHKLFVRFRSFVKPFNFETLSLN